MAVGRKNSLFANLGCVQVSAVCKCAVCVLANGKLKYENPKLERGQSKKGKKTNR
jgi:hypothetical protein